MRIKAALKDDGIIVIDTPNMESIFSRFRGQNWRGLGRYHLYYFSYSTLIRLLEDTGFEPLSSMSHKSNITSFDALWRWGLISYHAYIWLEKTFVLSKVCSNIDAPVKKMYENKQFGEIRKVIEDQIDCVLQRKAPVDVLLKTINKPISRLLGGAYAGDALRVVAKKK